MHAYECSHGVLSDCIGLAKSYLTVGAVDPAVLWEGLDHIGPAVAVQRLKQLGTVDLKREKYYDTAEEQNVDSASRLKTVQSLFESKPKSLRSFPQVLTTAEARMIE